MFGNHHFHRVRQLFADQFVSDSRGFVYRKSQKGAPIRVNQMERDKFVATFNTRLRYATWSILPATVCLILLLVWLNPDAESLADQMVMWIGMAAILAPFMGILYWAWNAPSRELQRRTPEGVALTKEQARALALSKITYGQLVSAAVIGVLLVLRMSTKTDIFHGWGAVWLVFGGGLIALTVVQAFRKWRLRQ